MQPYFWLGIFCVYEFGSVEHLHSWRLHLGLHSSGAFHFLMLSSWFCILYSLFLGRSFCVPADLSFFNLSEECKHPCNCSHKHENNEKNNKKYKAKNKIKIKMLGAVNKIRLLISWATRILQIIIKIPTILHSKITIL